MTPSANKISSGGIPNSSSLYPHVWLHRRHFLHSGFAHMDNVISKRYAKKSYGYSCQGGKATNHTETLRNLPNPASETYTSTHGNSPQLPGTLRNLHQHTGIFRNLPEPASGTYRPELSRTERNVPAPEPSGAYTSTHPNSPELSGTCLSNLHQPAHTGTLRSLPEPSGTFRNLPLKPTPASTHWNSPEPSGTSSCDLHRHTPELIWAEDPISLRC